MGTLIASGSNQRGCFNINIGTKWAPVSRIIILSLLTSFSLTSCYMNSRFIDFRNDGEFIEYAGAITLSGFYFLDASNLETRKLVCFFPDAAGQNLLPRDSDTNPFHWMCFSNSTEARELLRLNPALDSDSICYKGFSRITIRKYHRYIGESEGVSSSELVNVHESDTALEVPCPDIWQHESP